MPFVKVLKNKAYFKRFQVKWARRRCKYTCTKRDRLWFLSFSDI